MSAEGGAETGIPVELQHRLIQRLGDLNMLPGIARQAMDIAQDPNGSMDKLAHVVERDVKLAADILVLANSAVFAGGKKISSLHTAIVRLGLRQCKNLILTSSVTSLRKKLSTEQQWAQENLWQHGYATAMLAYMLNRTLGSGFQGEEYTAGLVHDLGRTLLAVAFPNDFARIDPMTFDETAEVLAHERSLVGVDHAQLGAWFVAMNNFPEALAEAVRRHHHAEQPQPHQRLTLVVAAADHMANYLQRIKKAEGYDPAQNGAIALLQEGGLKHATVLFRENCLPLMDHAAKEAREMMAL